MDTRPGGRGLGDVPSRMLVPSRKISCFRLESGVLEFYWGDDTGPTIRRITRSIDCLLDPVNGLQKSGVGGGCDPLPTPWPRIPTLLSHQEIQADVHFIGQASRTHHETESSAGVCAPSCTTTTAARSSGAADRPQHLLCLDDGQ